MKLWPNSSIQTCHARLLRGAGSFLSGCLTLGEGFASGVVSVALGDGVAGTDTGVIVGWAETTGKTVGLGEGCWVCWGGGATGGTTSVFFCDRNTRNGTKGAARIPAPTTNGLQLTGDFCPAADPRGRGAPSADGDWAAGAISSSPKDAPSNSRMAAANGGMCFESGWLKASSQCGALK